MLCRRAGPTAFGTSSAQNLSTQPFIDPLKGQFLPCTFFLISFCEKLSRPEVPASRRNHPETGGFTTEPTGYTFCEKQTLHERKVDFGSLASNTYQKQYVSVCSTSRSLGQWTFSTSEPKSEPVSFNRLQAASAASKRLQSEPTRKQNSCYRPVFPV